MILTIILSIIFLLLGGLCTIQSVYGRMSEYEVPILYQSILIKFILGLSVVSFWVVSIFFIFYNWKLLIILFIGLALFGRTILWSVSEMLIIYPIFKLLHKQ